MLFRCDLCLYVDHFKFMLTKVAISTLSLFFIYLITDMTIIIYY